MFPGTPLGSGGGEGLKGSCGKTKDDGSWAGLFDSWLVGLLWVEPVFEPLLLWVELEDFARVLDRLELPLERLFLPGELRSL